MDYRNERDALRGRVESLEQELSEAHRELADARWRETEASTRGARMEAERLEATRLEAKAIILRLQQEKKPDPPFEVPVILFALPILGALLTAVGAVGKIWVRHSEAAVIAQPTGEAPAGHLGHVRSGRRQEQKVSWRAEVTSATGGAPLPGTACTVDATVEGIAEDIRLEDLDVTCGGTPVFSAGRELVPSAASQAVSVHDHTTLIFHYDIQYEETGAGKDERGRIAIDSAHMRGAVWRDDVPAFRVDFKMHWTSDVVIVSQAQLEEDAP